VSLLSKAWSTLRDEGLPAFAGKVARKARFWLEQARLPYVRTLALDGGESLQVYVNTPFSRQWYTAARATSPEIAWIRQALRPGDVVADVGANNGFTGILFARAVGAAGRVVGFEPSPANLEAARQNIRLNQVGNFELVAAAVGAEPGTVSFDPGFGNGAVASGGPITVPQVTLDAHFGASRVDLLKLDIEGYELAALRGARRLLEARPALAIEIHVACYADRERQVRELLGMLDLPAYDAWIQLEVDGALVRFDPAAHTAKRIAQHDNVHWLAVPKARAG
jgi:FkbM family methyltransferase